MSLLAASETSLIPVLQRESGTSLCPAEYDIVILGGGCAGLSLAMRLATLGHQCPRVLVLEQRSHYTNDRSWCFWDREETPLGHMVTRRWAFMRILDCHRSVTVSCGDTPYQMIAAESFYAQALTVLKNSPHIDLILGLPVLAAPAKRGRHWQIETSRGLKTALTVVDTRPRQKPQRGGAVLWQSFSGQEVNCAEPVFEPGCVDLMDFSHREPAGVSFHYVLPLSPYRALIEVARFAVQPFGPEHLAADLTEAISRRVGGAPFTIVRSESGVLPMGFSPPATSPPTSRDPSYVYAGLAGGGARPSTGYAFQRIQRWADSCAQRIREGESPAGHPGDSLLLRAMDHVFLSVLRTQPEAAPEVFLSLFERADTARVIRFLSDRGTVADYLAIIAALPFGPFLRELPRGLMRMAGRTSA